MCAFWNLSAVNERAKRLQIGKWFGEGSDMKFLRDLFEAIWKGFFPPKRKRLEVRLCSWNEADRLLRAGDWSLVHDENYRNVVLGLVWLERLEPEPFFNEPSKPWPRT